MTQLDRPTVSTYPGCESGQRSDDFRPCCCCSSRTGSLVIGILQIIGCVLGLIVALWMISALSELKQDVEDPRAIEYVQNLLRATLVLAVFGLIIAVVLIVGVLQAKPVLIKIWIGSQVVCMVLSLILNPMIAIANPQGSGSTVATCVSSTLISLWYLFVVYHYLTRELGSYIAIPSTGATAP